MMWRDIFTSPEGRGKFFLVRPPGINQRDGKAFVPSVVQRIGNEVYSSTNEIDPLIWSKINFSYMQPTSDVYEAGLVWHPLPGDKE
jgi:hypothetical protein